MHTAACLSYASTTQPACALVCYLLSTARQIQLVPAAARLCRDPCLINLRLAEEVTESSRDVILGRAYACVPVRSCITRLVERRTFADLYHTNQRGVKCGRMHSMGRHACLKKEGEKIP